MSVLSLKDIMKMNKEKIEELKKLGVETYASSFARTYLMDELMKYIDLEPGEEVEYLNVAIAGRIKTLRGSETAIFGYLEDISAQIQVYARKEELGDDQFKIFSYIGVGDFVGIKGSIFKTKKGEVTVRVKEFELLSKALRILPKNWAELSDKSIKLEKKYLDLMSNRKAKDVIIQRGKIVNKMRDFLLERSFIEVDTPAMYKTSGLGIKPHFNTLYKIINKDFFLRSNLGLHLRKLLVGGFEQIFEIGRVFRNEKRDAMHSPEYSVISIYEAYKDYQNMMNIAEEMLKELVKDVKKVKIFKYLEKELDFTKPFSRKSLKDLFKENLGMDIIDMSLEELTQLLKANQVVLPNVNTWDSLVYTIYEKLIPKLKEPMIIFNFPKNIYPAARAITGNENFVESFEIIIGGLKIGRGFNALIDPQEQLERLKKKGDLLDSFDIDYMEALEYGMPPTSSLELGIERLAMLLTNRRDILDCQLFPGYINNSLDEDTKLKEQVKED